MKALLAVPDSGALAPDLIHQILERFDGVRVDVDSDDHARMWAQAHSLAAVPECWPIFLLFGHDMTRAGGEPWQPDDMLQHLRNEIEKLKVAGFEGRELTIEFGNEADLAHKRWKRAPLELGELYADALKIVWEASPLWHLLSPSISNLDEDSLEYLRRMNLPPGSEIAFHRYSPGREFGASHRGFRDRLAEVETLRSIARGAKLYHTEGGWSEITSDYTLSELEVADRMAAEVKFWKLSGVELFCAYQINSADWKANDSDDTKRLATYGARRVDGSWKPWADAVREARG